MYISFRKYLVLGVKNNYLEIIMQHMIMDLLVILQYSMLK